MRRLAGSDEGFSALWVALVAFFLLGAAALAVDMSGAFNTARTDQNIADLACLAGVFELPDDTSAGINMAVDYAVDNWPQMAGHTSTISGTTGTYTDGGGNGIYVDAAYEGDTSKMYLRITEITNTYFGRVLGRDTITVSQEAWCRATVQAAGSGGLPFGALPGGYDGGLQAPNPCGENSGNCGRLWIPRDDVSGNGPTTIRNIAEGTDRILDAWLGPIAGAVRCDLVSAGDSCHIIETNTGVSANHLGEGFLQRLEDDPGATCTTIASGRVINCDTPAQVLGSDPTPLMTAFPTQPSWWEPSLYGAYNATNTSNHFYYNGVIAKCDSPRLGHVPIITDNMNWNIGDPPTGWPNGRKNVKVIGRYWVIVVHPNDSSDWHGNGNLKTASSIVMWWGPDTECQGPGGSTFPFDPDNPGITAKRVFLVDDTN